MTDDRCKVLSLGKTGVALSGVINYEKKLQSDAMQDWDALVDAKSAYSSEGDDTQKIAAEWARLSVLHYQEFYRFAPNG